MCLRLFTLLSFASCLSSFANTTPSDSVEDWSLSVFFENDLFADTDQNYTNGVKLSVVSPDITDYMAKLPSWSSGLVDLLPFVSGDGKPLSKNIGFSLGQAMYTPQDISSSNLIANDRPYAGWLYGGLGFHSKTVNTLDTIELQFGVVGPGSAAEDAQKFVHSARKLQKPLGWHHQLRNEPGFVGIYEHKRRFAPNNNSGLGYDAIVHYGAALGNVYTYANVGAQIRLGWNVPADFGNPIIRPAGDVAPFGFNRKRANWSFHTFLSAEGRGVLRDITLDGNTFRSSHSVDKKPFVGDVAVGFSFGLRDMRFTYAQVFRTKEFTGQSDEHTFGSISLSLYF